MAPKKKVVAEPPPVEEQEPEEPEEPEIFKKCFRSGGQMYYGECKAGTGDKQGRVIRHGYGRQVTITASPAGFRQTNPNRPTYEAIVQGIYEGNFEEDVLTGQGNYKWSDGAYYEGHFTEGQLNGHGRFVWADGSAYEGSFAHGTLSGQGRLDSRFDGKFHQGKFQRNSFQQGGQRWLPILEKAANEDKLRVSEGNGIPLKVVRCTVDAFLQPSASDSEAEMEQKALFRTIQQIHSDNLVPFFVAEANVPKTAMRCLLDMGLISQEAPGVSVRHAAIAHRRRRDCHRFFFESIQDSLKSGRLFTVAFEDDDEACSLLQEEYSDWATRQSKGVPQKPLHEDWKLSHFFFPTAFPEIVFQPVLFNCQNWARTFLPEAAPPTSGPLSLPEVAPVAAAAGGVSREQSKENPPVAEAAGATKAQETEETKRIKELLETASAGVNGNVVGQTGHFFEAEEDDLKAAKLEIRPFLRPAVLSFGRIPCSLGDEEVKLALSNRFSAHVPLHRTVVVILGRAPEASEMLN